MSQIVPFMFAETTSVIRVVEIEGEPWFVGRDVADALGYTNPAKAMGDHCKGVTKRYPLPTAGGEQEIRILSESDVLRLVVHSRLPAAERFERWVFEEVLPCIRRTGRYEAAAPPPPEPQFAIPQTLPEALRLAADLADQVAEKAALLAVAGPKANALDRFANLEGTFSLREAAKTLAVPERKFLRFLDGKWIYRHAFTTTWLAYAEPMARGYVEHKTQEGDRPDGSHWARTQVRITTRGLSKLALMLNDAQGQATENPHGPQGHLHLDPGLRGRPAG